MTEVLILQLFSQIGPCKSCKMITEVRPFTSRGVANTILSEIVKNKWSWGHLLVLLIMVGLISFCLCLLGNSLLKRPPVENSPVLLLVALPRLFYQLMMRFHCNVKDCYPSLFRTMLFWRSKTLLFPLLFMAAFSALDLIYTRVSVILFPFSSLWMCSQKSFKICFAIPEPLFFFFFGQSESAPACS